MCPLREDTEYRDYKPIKVNNIIASFEKLASCDKSNQLVRSESAVCSRSNSARKNTSKRRHAKSEVIAKDTIGEAIYENIRPKNQELSVRRIQRLESITETDSGDTVQYDNIQEVRSKAQAVLKKYEDEVIADLDKKHPSHIFDQSIYLIENESDDYSVLDDDSEGIRSRDSSISIDDEYVSLSEAQDYSNRLNCNSENEYCVLQPLSYDGGRYVPQYENISAIRDMGKPVNYRKNSTLIRSNTITQTISCPNNNSIVSNGTAKRPSKDKKKYIVEELIHTEERYIQDLLFVIKNYMKYISDTYTGEPLRKYKFIYINIEMICSESIKLLEDIKSQGYNYEAIARTFCQHKYLMERYTVYCKNKKVSEDLIKGNYSEIIEKRRKEICDPLGLASYLLKPIQRLLRYEMFFRNLNKYITKEGGEATCINEAIGLIQRTARRGNDLIIINCIQDMPHCLSDTGDFIMGDSFRMLSPKKMDIELFLFKTMIVFAAKKGVDSFVYKTYIPVEHLTKSSDSHKTTITLEDYFMRKKHKDPIYILDAMNMEKKKKWVQRIDDILWRQLLEIRERARNNT